MQDILIRIANVYQVSIDYLVGRTAQGHGPCYFTA